jgi:starvation-inducible outer membrane lipoprotein
MKKTIKSNKMTKMTRKTRKPKMIRKTRKTRKTMKLTSQQPLVLYSKNNRTGEETVAALTKKDNNTMHGYSIAVQSQIPPTIHKSSNGSTVMTMSQKRSLVVENYKNLGQNRVKLPRVVRSKVKY